MRRAAAFETASGFTTNASPQNAVEGASPEARGHCRANGELSTWAMKWPK
jgi:hypothetical protein